LEQFSVLLCITFASAKCAFYALRFTSYLQKITQYMSALFLEKFYLRMPKNEINTHFVNIEFNIKLCFSHNFFMHILKYFDHLFVSTAATGKSA
jgi:hypothetical protein